jgi:hypothetical protein
MIVSLRIKKKNKLSKALMKSRGVHGQTNYLDLHKRLISLFIKYHVL